MREVRVHLLHLCNQLYSANKHIVTFSFLDNRDLIEPFLDNRDLIELFLDNRDIIELFLDNRDLIELFLDNRDLIELHFSTTEIFLITYYYNKNGRK